jgi:hypothetical protein
MRAASFLPRPAVSTAAVGRLLACGPTIWSTLSLRWESAQGRGAPVRNASIGDSPVHDGAVEIAPVDADVLEHGVALAEQKVVVATPPGAFAGPADEMFHVG